MGKEMDEAHTIAGVSCVGLYYYGARYLDPKYSRWISTDPALGEYIPKAPINDDARKHNQNLPGMGGIYNTINSNLYHYAGNNPVKYTDPDGNIIIDADYSIYQQSGNDNLNETRDSIYDYGCTLTTYTRMARALGADITVDEANQIAMNTGCFSEPNLLTPGDGAKLVNEILKSQGITDVSISFESSFYNDKTPYNLRDAADSYVSYDSSSSEFFCSARIWTNGSDSISFFEHSVNVPSNAAFGDSCFGRLNNLKLKDSSRVNRDQVLGCCSGRNNSLLRLDFFKINRSENNE